MKPTAQSELLVKGVPVDRETATGKESATVKLVDFDNPTANAFHANNQFRIDTPGQVKSHLYRTRWKRRRSSAAYRE